jgi:hypothetical protein
MKLRAFLLALPVLAGATAAFAGDAPFGIGIELTAGYERQENPVAFIDEFDVIRRGDGKRVSESPFRTLAVDADLELPLPGGATWLAALDLEARRLPKIPALDRDRLKFLTGPSHAFAKGEMVWQLVVDELSLPRAGLRRHGRGLQASYFVQDETDRGRLTVEWLRLRHEGADDLYDADRLAVRYAHRHMLSGAWQPALRLRLGTAGERNRWGYEDLSLRELQGEAELAVVPRPSWTLSMALAGRASRFLGAAPDLDFRRRDRRGSLKLAAEYAFDKTRRLRCEFEAVNRSSNDFLAEARLRRFGCQAEIGY